MDQIIAALCDEETFLTLEFRKKLAEFLLDQQDRVSDLVMVNKQLVGALNDANERVKKIDQLVTQVANDILTSSTSKEKVQ